jgi:hypothetical protein
VIPTPPQSKPVAFYDTECYRNYWVLKIRVQNGPIFSFRLGPGQSFSDGDRIRISDLFAMFMVVSFNGIYYDVPMICAALAGFSCEQLKWLSDEIIQQKRKPWELNLPIDWQPADHIDIMQVLPGEGSQKSYAGRIHCKRMQDLPFEPDRWLSDVEIVELDSYCENDLDVLEELYKALEPQRVMRTHLSKRYGVDLRSKSDAQMAEAVIKLRCEQAIGQRIYKPDIDWNLKFRYNPPAWVAFQTPQLHKTLEIIKECIFGLGANGMVEMPPALKGLEIPLGQAIYRMGIGGLHSSEKCVSHVADDTWCLRDNDVASYYPNLILLSGEFPKALGPVFLDVLCNMKDERLDAKSLERSLKKNGDTASYEFQIAHVENEGMKVMINGTFGKTGSPFSILFAPKMMIQTTITGQLGMLMLVEWHEHYGIQVVSANTDGFIIRCRRNQVHFSEHLIAQWQEMTGLEMETTEYKAVYSRDVNNYFAIKSNEVKRKGEYSKSGLIEKKNPDCEICSDAVADMLLHGTPILYTLASCRDIRKFVTVQKVTGGGVKMWGDGPQFKLVRDMIPTIEANGWARKGRMWTRGLQTLSASEAYAACFEPQRPEYLGKVIRWYYGVNSPGPIVYQGSGNMVGLSYGAKPCMTLPDEFPSDIDYAWYMSKCETILKEIGYDTRP